MDNLERTQVYESLTNSKENKIIKEVKFNLYLVLFCVYYKIFIFTLEMDSQFADGRFSSFDSLFSIRLQLGIT